jgi:hypothetical protein
MLLLRPKSQSVVNVPLGFIAILAVMIVLFVGFPSARESNEMLASSGVFGLLSLGMIVLDLRVTARKADELRVRWSFGGTQGLAQDFVLRAGISGSRSPSLRVELLPRVTDGFEQGTLVAVLSASAKGRVQAEAIAKLLDVPLTGDLSQLGGK